MKMLRGKKDGEGGTQDLLRSSSKPGVRVKKTIYMIDGTLFFRSVHPMISMGTAWASTEAYPWEQGLYVGGIETAKVNFTLRIYAGLAILNRNTHTQIHQYAKSACSN